MSESEQGFDAQVRGLLTAIEKLVADLAPATRELVEQYRKHPPGRNAQSRQQQAAGRFAFPLCYGDLLRQQKDELTPEQEALLEADLEASFHPENLVGHEVAVKKMSRWLK